MGNRRFGGHTAPISIQRACAGCKDDDDVLQRAVGNRAIGEIQPKLTIGRPNDRYEHEADRVADLVMHSAEPVPSASQPGAGAPLMQAAAISALPRGRVQREATETCSVKDEPLEEGMEEEPEEAGGATAPAGAATPVQPKGGAGAPVSPEGVESRLNAARGRGAALPHDTRRFMESRFGHDFSAVRVHTGPYAQHLNRDIHSLAFTTGTDIYFGAGRFRPGTPAGDHLLAHELTHVVQQAGGASGVVREKADPGTLSRKVGDVEKKPYYRHRVSGQFVHGVLERILRGADEKKELVTEAAIPGADRFSKKLNKIGVADLYKSDPPLTVSGVKGLRDVANETDVIGMNNPRSIGTQPGVTSSPTRPPRRAGVRGWRGDFPSTVWLGEIKPASTTKAGAGIAQLDSYEHGYKEFVARVHTLSGGATRASLGVKRLTVKLPNRLNFDRWSTEHKKPSRDTTFGDRRLWVANVGQGLYLYTDFARGLEGAPPDWFSKFIAKMRTLQDTLKKKHPRTGKMLAGKFLPGGPRVGASRVAKAERPKRFLQRSTKDRPANYWADQGRAWEKQRSTWGKEFRSTLKTRFKDYHDKVRFERRLGKAGRTPGAVEKKAVRDYKQLLFWSGRPGKFLGKVRFLLGGAWDKALGVFERMKEKMAGVRKRVKEVKSSSIIPGGWAKKLIRIIVDAAKVAVGRFITESFNFFVGCFHSAMDKAAAKFAGQLNEKFAEELCNARKLFEDSKKRLETEWGASIKKIEELLAALKDAKRWLDIASGLITLIRAGVQVVSCLTPPALGCLWGLVAQIGLSAAINLLVGTQWFNDNIVTPTVRDLVRKYGTPHYQKLINRALGDGLKEYHCHIADTAFPSLDFKGTGGLAKGSAALRAHRDAWESAHESALLKDLQKVFGKGKKGKKVSKEELLKLAKRLQESKRTPEELKAMLEAARDPLTGKLEVGKAKANVEKDEVIEATPKVRDIDYPDATRQNAIYQKMLGWDPFTFYKKPGVRADSEEFADAVYDIQKALRIKADGILGEETLIAFYDRNRIRKDIPYRDAVKMREEKKAARRRPRRRRPRRKRSARRQRPGPRRNRRPRHSSCSRGPTTSSATRSCTRTFPAVFVSTCTAPRTAAW